VKVGLPYLTNGAIRELLREFSASVRDGWKAFLLGSVSRR
jgi:hypothetical protein